MSIASTPSVEAPSDAWVALERACEHLLSLQDGQGWWKGELESNVTMDAEDMLLREFLGIRGADETARRAPGSAPGSVRTAPGRTSTAPRRPLDDDRGLLGAAPGGRLPGGGAHARGGHVRPLARGGRAARACSRTSGSPCSGCGPGTDPGAAPRDHPAAPWVPLNIYDFGCWARQTIVALSIVRATGRCTSCPSTCGAARPCVPREPWQGPRRAPAAASGCAPGSLLGFYERRPLTPLGGSPSRRRALDRAPARGGRLVGGIQPPWVYSLMAL